MKKYIILFSLLAGLSYSQSAKAQGLAVNTSGTGADNSAMLDVNTTTKGILIPRMTNSQVSAISSPANGLMVYQTDGTAGFYYNSGTSGTPVWTYLFNSSSNINGSNLQDNSVTVSKLPSGATSTTYLRGDGTWATPASSGGGPTVEVIASINASTSTTSIPSNSSGTLNYNNVTTNIGSQFNGTTFTATSAGMYLVTASYSASNGGHSQATYVKVNGTAVEWGAYTSNNTNTTPNTTMSTISTVLSLNAADALTIATYSGNAVSTTNTNGTARLTITKLQ